MKYHHSSYLHRDDHVPSALKPGPYHSRRRTRLVFICVVIVIWCNVLLQSNSIAKAHQSIAFPRPMTREVACRITKRQSCPGPCPNSKFRLDRLVDNPSITAGRGKRVEIRILRNNHDGGFSRWSLVNIHDRMNRRRHHLNAFAYSCTDLRVNKCSSRYRRRDCQYDKSNEYFTHFVTIPTCAPDGVYVLSWAWYGGGTKWGHFGDYYDCMYIHIKGGASLTKFCTPQFVDATKDVSRTGKYHTCRATVNRLGICYREPCPGGIRRTQFFKPAPFERSRKPPLIYRSYFKPYTPASATSRKTPISPRITSMTIRSADTPSRIYAVIRPNSNKDIWLKITTRFRITITCEVDRVSWTKGVGFYTQGRFLVWDSKSPYSIAGDWTIRKKRRFAKWAYDFNDKVLPISCVVHGRDGSQDWLSIELSTSLK